MYSLVIKMVEMENREMEKKIVWTAQEIKDLLDKGKLPYVENRDRYKVIEYKLFDEVERKLYRMR